MPSDPSPEAGYTRLYRVEPKRSGSQIPDWIKAAQIETGHADAQGRWFVSDPAMLEWYREDLGHESKTMFVDVPSRELEQYRVSNCSEQIGRRPVKSYSRDQENEFFLPRELADKKRESVELMTYQIKDMGREL